MNKRIAIATLGTLGDVAPYVALAVELQRQGHSVVIGAPNDFAAFIEGYGIEFRDLGTNIQSFLTQARFEEAVAQNRLLNYPVLLHQGLAMVKRAAAESWEMAQGADAILFNMNTNFGVDIAEVLRIPAIMTALAPLSPTSEFPYCFYYGPSFGPLFNPLFNRLSYAVQSIQQTYYDLPRNQLRRKVLGLQSPAGGGFSRDSLGAAIPSLYAFSEHVSPRPADWPASASITGYWRLHDNTGWTPSREFRAFLNAGPPPVYIGFGSMPFRAERNSEILLEAARLWGGRIVVGKGWGGITPSSLPKNIFAIDMAPHDRLFEHVGAVIHHGGAGTTSAGLHAGRPAMAVPQQVDQPYWGRRIYELGCGPRPIRLQKLTAENLAASLAELTGNPAYAKSAAALASQLNAENGPARAADLVENIIAEYRPRTPYQVRERRRQGPAFSAGR